MNDLIRYSDDRRTRRLRRLVEVKALTLAALPLTTLDASSSSCRYSAMSSIGLMSPSAVTIGGILSLEDSAVGVAGVAAAAAT